MQRNVSSIAISGTDVTLTLASPELQTGQSVTVAYEAPTGAGSIRSTTGTDAASFAARKVTNSLAATIPSLSKAEVNGQHLRLEYDEPLDYGATPNASAFTVTVDGDNAAVVGLYVEQQTVTLVLMEPVSPGASVSADYTKPSEREMQDLGGTDIPAFTGQSVTNITPAPVPMAQLARHEARQVTIIFNRPILSTPAPLATDFTVTTSTGVTSQAVRANSVAVEGKRVSLELEAELAEAATVTVAYRPTRGSELRDTSGTHVASFGDLSSRHTSETDVQLAHLSLHDSGRHMYPPFDPDTHHYATRCGANDRLSLEIQRVTQRTAVYVNSAVLAPETQLREVGGLSPDDDIVIELQDGTERGLYVLHCIPHMFPVIDSRFTTAASDELTAFATSVSSGGGTRVSFLILADNYGVPRHHRTLRNVVAGSFVHHPNGAHPFSYMERIGQLPTNSTTTLRLYEAVIMDHNLDVVERVQTTDALVHTDGHDFFIKSNGDYLFLAYEPALRIFPWREEGEDDITRRAWWTEDSVIELVRAGDSIWTWNSYDEMELFDCYQHAHPADYAHVNSVSVVKGGDVLISLRGCSQLWLLDGNTGATVWKIGHSNSSEAEWRRNLISVQGDPYGEFCGQHSARQTASGTIVLFDNGTSCQVPRGVDRPERASRRFSRVVEYRVDATSNTATFVRHHSYGGGFDRYDHSRGNVVPLDSGNWLISWGSHRLQDSDPNTVGAAPISLSEIEPSSGNEVLAMTIFGDGVRKTVTASRVEPSILPPPRAAILIREEVLSHILDENVTEIGHLATSETGPDTDDLRWSLHDGETTDGRGVDNASFTLSDDGLLSFLVGKDFEHPDDADGDNVYEVAVQVSDGTFTTAGLVSVSVNDVNEPPAIRGPAHVRFTENSPTSVASYMIDDPESSSTGVSLSGSDAGQFVLDGNQLRFVAPPDADDPQDTDNDNTYHVSVVASDGNSSSTLDVSVIVQSAAQASSSTSPPRSTTAAPIDSESDPPTAQVILANGWSPADIGIAAVLSARMSPSAVLFTAADRLSAPTRDLLVDAGPIEVIAVGGEAALSAAALTEAVEVARSPRRSRLNGADRADTAVAAARLVLQDVPPSAATVILANGWRPADIGAATTLAARTPNSAVMYTTPAALGAGARSFLRSYQPTRMVIIGGVAAVSRSTEQEVRELVPGTDLLRLGGTGRASTAAAVAQRIMDMIRSAAEPTVVLANGWRPPDIAVAAALASRTENSIALYTETHRLPEATLLMLRSLQPGRIVAVGGSAVIAGQVRLDALRLAPEATFTRYGGPSRIHSAAAVARHALRAS